MITLYWCPRTRASRTLWLLEELGQPFNVHRIDLRDEEARNNAGFRAASPMGKVPALADGRIKMADSAAIAIYLADRYPQAGLAPALDDPQRGRYLFWSTFTPGAIEPAMAEKLNGWKVSRATSGWGNFDQVVETLDQGLRSGPWILGKQFSAADTLVGSSLYFMKLFGILPERQQLHAYLERCLARPAYVTALARDSDLSD